MTFGHPDTFDSTRSFSAAASSGSLLCSGMFWFDVVWGSLVFSWVFFFGGVGRRIQRHPDILYKRLQCHLKLT